MRIFGLDNEHLIVRYTRFCDDWHQEDRKCSDSAKWKMRVSTLDFSDHSWGMDVHSKEDVYSERRGGCDVRRFGCSFRQLSEKKCGVAEHWILSEDDASEWQAPLKRFRLSSHKLR